MRETKYRICPLCEATCGLSIEVEGREIRSVRGNESDVFSHGFICPKGPALAELDQDPDRLREPLVRRNGGFLTATWEEAFAEIEKRLPPIIASHGNDAVAVYLGNPTAHNFSLAIYGQALIRGLRTKNIYTASTVDQIPKQLASGLMFGTYTTIAVPDIERTDLLLMLGANPFESNGSLWTVPDFPGRLRALRKRGGRCIVVDPRRTRTAEAAGEHIFIRPGTDAYFLIGVVHCLFADGLVRLGHLAGHTNGVVEVERVARDFPPETVSRVCGVPPDVIRKLAHDLAKTERAAVYGRIGTCTQEFGTLASWLVDVCNVLAGNLDRPGGMMFSLPAAFGANTLGTPGTGRGIRTGRRHSRVRNAPEVMGELPVACLAEEIETLGPGQIRALITVAGNPVLSTPNGARLSKALASLDFMVSLDIYLNETSRHANVILPGLSPFEQGHFDVALAQFGYRNAARFSTPVFAPPQDRPTEWQALLRLTAIVSGQGANADVDALDDFIAMGRVQHAVSDPNSPIRGRDPSETLQALAPRRGPERVLDLALRSGPYGDAFGAEPDGLSLAKLEANPNGIDLGPLQPRIPECLRTPSGKIELAPEPLIEDLQRLRSSLDRTNSNGSLFLVGRRHLRSNNSWMHNLPKLARGRNRCTLQIHPDDAARLNLEDGRLARVSSRVGSVSVPVEITDTIMPGVVSLPHGWGHDDPGARLSVASKRPGVNSNLLADELMIEPLSGNAVLNGIPVTVEALAV
jgi:anaerobic selenocysteine-containing dehydrogenase